MVSAVVLAAGASTRMGTHKLLLPLGDEPIARRTVRQVCDAGFDEVLVVVGNEWERVLSTLEGLPIRHAVNGNYRSGMGSSFRTGDRAPRQERRGDVCAGRSGPFVTTNEYRAVLDAYRKDAPGIVSVRLGP